MRQLASHYAAGHVPFRTDCAVCLEAAGRDRAPEPYCWSMDLAGPFEEGIDQICKNPKYFMVSVATIPVEDNTTLAAGLEALRAKKMPRKDRAPFLEPEEEQDLGRTCCGRNYIKPQKNLELWR